MNIHLKGVEKAGGIRVFDTLPDYGVIIAPVHAFLADFSLGKQEMIGADELVIVQSHQDRHAPLFYLGEYRWRELIINVVKMSDIRTGFI